MSSPAPYKRTRVFLACIHCRRLKQKCMTDGLGERPCDRCVRKNIKCEYLTVGEEDEQATGTYNSPGYSQNPQSVPAGSYHGAPVAGEPMSPPVHDWRAASYGQSPQNPLPGGSQFQPGQNYPPFTGYSYGTPAYQQGYPQNFGYQQYPTSSQHALSRELAPTAANVGSKRYLAPNAFNDAKILSTVRNIRNVPETMYRIATSALLPARVHSSLRPRRPRCVAEALTRRRRPRPSPVSHDDVPPRHSHRSPTWSAYRCPRETELAEELSRRLAPSIPPLTGVPTRVVEWRHRPRRPFWLCESPCASNETKSNETDLFCSRTRANAPPPPLLASSRPPPRNTPAPRQILGFPRLAPPFRRLAFHAQATRQRRLYSTDDQLTRQSASTVTRDDKSGLARAAQVHPTGHNQLLAASALLKSNRFDANAEATLADFVQVPSNNKTKLTLAATDNAPPFSLTRTTIPHLYAARIPPLHAPHPTLRRNSRALPRKPFRLRRQLPTWSDADSVRKTPR
ncbi:hypothetical protein R3P38DRAFT_2804344 [Favolaschia claudopus]|uniref:Zn(2)-C6 fungal-type domain-containing protein n=1 Tax=Favolaschia claudopus TaxID=2862362 RepID=A0AAV9ZQB3_9AGAR